jgi:hypothetical protein
MDIVLFDVPHYFPSDQLDGALVALGLLGYTRLPKIRFVESSLNPVSDENMTISVGNRFFYLPLTGVDAEEIRSGFLRVWELHKVAVDTHFYKGKTEMSQGITLDNIPAELYSMIAMNLKDEEINRLCQVNQEFKAQVCDNNAFWHQKFVKKFGEDTSLKMDWKKIYNDEKQIEIFYGTDKITGKLRFKAKKIIVHNDVYNDTYHIIDDTDRLIINMQKSTELIPLRVIDVAVVVPWGVGYIYAITSERKLVYISGDMRTNAHKIISSAVLDANLPPIKTIYGGKSMALIDTEDNLYLFAQLPISLEMNYEVKITLPVSAGMKAKTVSIGTGHISIIGLDDYVYILGNVPPGISQPTEQIRLGNYSLIKTDIRAKMVKSLGNDLAIIDMENKLHLYDYSSTILEAKSAKFVSDKQVKYVAMTYLDIMVIDMTNEVWVFSVRWKTAGPLGVKAYQIEANSLSAIIVHKGF